MNSALAAEGLPLYGTFSAASSNIREWRNLVVIPPTTRDFPLPG
jgi:hypothetical protein